MLPDLPGWDSLPTVSRYHSVAEIAGILILAALVVAEIVAYRYGKRKDFLTEQQQHATDQSHEDEMARLHVDAARLARDAEELRQKNLAFESAISPRIVEQTDAGNALKPFADMKVVVLSPDGDFEARRTAGQIRALLRIQAGWQKLSVSLTHPPAFFDTVVVHWGGHQGDAKAARADLDVARLLVEQLKAMGIEARTGAPMSELGIHGIAVLVGAKPLPPVLQKKYEGKTYGSTLEEPP